MLTLTHSNERLPNNRRLLTRVLLLAKCKRIKQIKNVTHGNYCREKKENTIIYLLRKVYFSFHKLLISITMAEGFSEMAIMLPLRWSK